MDIHGLRPFRLFSFFVPLGGSIRFFAAAAFGFLLGDAGDPGFSRKLKDALRPVAERGLGLDGGAFDPYLFEFAASGILAAATLWYERGRDLGPAELGEGLRSLLSSVQESAARNSL